MKKILVTGAWWMLATELLHSFVDEYVIIWLTKKELDITDIVQVQAKIREIRPDCVINCAAYTDVDRAEGVWKECCHAVNVLWVQNISKITAQEVIDLITLSTDYVFDGAKLYWYTEGDICNPINVYGKSKYEGEIEAIKNNPDTIIVRTSWLYGGWREYKNFVNTMLSLAEKKKEITVVNDQFWCPTNCQDLAGALLKVMQDMNQYRGTILHLTNTTPPGWLTWYDFAQKIFSLTKQDVSVIPCSHRTFWAAAKRPEYSKLINTSNIVLRDWEEALQEYLTKY